MNEQVQIYIEKYPSEVAEAFKTLRRLIYDSADVEPVEALWAKLPSYYVGESFVRLIPFKDHINIEAKAISDHINELSSYKNNAKGNAADLYVSRDSQRRIKENIC